VAVTFANVGLHLRHDLLAFGVLLGARELVARKADLLAAHRLSPGLRSRLHSRVQGLCYPESK